MHSFAETFSPFSHRCAAVRVLIPKERGEIKPLRALFPFLQLPAGSLLLAAVEVGVDAVLLDELVVRAALDDLSAVLILFLRGSRRCNRPSPRGAGICV